MTEPIWVALIVAMQGVVVALISKVTIDARRTKRSTEAVKEQVANSHVLPNGEPYNLRDNIDHNQLAVLGEIRGIRRDIGRLDQRDIERGREMRELHVKIDELGTADRGAADRLTNIEDTLDLRKDRP
ncbi:hypothetical protein [Leucobacter chromiiresistens]|uniref:DUF2746 domain-containing protein n=1 Tax=Leucobacter chromiiresistens TaxID=1079994 RepID=A0A1H0XQ13_9MICO|nr:hypothetical protein [Leucobacter chromiiresistens]SDQ04861.1 hypothetical protein SAMN04488565_0015 [Leucobacter chromiiresistens]SDQ05318.1 hypothetical protein SAMN04488565_0069 [Leucobacter chromiiresistens]